MILRGDTIPCINNIGWTNFTPTLNLNPKGAITFDLCEMLRYPLVDDIVARSLKIQAR